MDYKEALKQVQAIKPKEPFMSVRIDLTMVLPHKDGIALLNAITNAERLINQYSSKPKITSLDRAAIEVHMLSREDYERVKICTLLDVSMEDVINAEAEANPHSKPIPF